MKVNGGGRSEGAKMSEPAEQELSCLPDVTCYPITDEDEFLILATDGEHRFTLMRFQRHKLEKY